MTDIDALVKEIRGNAMWRDNAVAALMNQAADAITSLQYALDKCKPFMGRNAVLEEAAKACAEKAEAHKAAIDMFPHSQLHLKVRSEGMQRGCEWCALDIRRLKSDEQDGSYAK